MDLEAAPLDASLDAKQPDPEQPDPVAAPLDAEQPGPEAAPLETIQEHAAQDFEEDNYDAEQADQEQLPELEEIYESDWSPAYIPDFVDICNDQHQSAHDEMCAESWEWVSDPPLQTEYGSNTVQETTFAMDRDGAC